jgi:hypothetical protein
MLLVDENPWDNGDPVLTTEEAARMDKKVLRRLAAEANTDAVTGRSVKLEWVSYLARQKTLSDFD